MANTLIKRGPMALQQLRLFRQKTLEEIAGEARVGKCAVSLWERRLREPCPKHRARYARALGISVGELGRMVYESSAADGAK